MDKTNENTDKGKDRSGLTWARANPYLLANLTPGNVFYHFGPF